MLRYKAGLHKEVSAIFNGVSLPKNDVGQQPSTTSAQGHQNSVASKPPESNPAAQKPSVPESPAPKPRAPSNITPTKPKSKQPPPSRPSKVTANQSKAGTAVKSAGQTSWQRTLEKIKNKLFAPKAGVSSTRQKVMVILVPVLFVVLIFVFIQVFIAKPPRKITGRRRRRPVEPATATVADNKVEWKVPEPYPTELRDPMQFGPVTAGVGQGDVSGLVVKGIVHSKDNPCAVIGDQILYQGDKVLGVVIVKINEDSVEFEVNGKKWTQKVQR